MQSPEEVEDMVNRLTSPEPSPDFAIQEPSRRRTEVYMRDDRLEEHIKLREDTDFNLQTIEKLRVDEQERNTDEATKEKVNKLIAANAATQETVAAMAALLTSLTQLIQAQQEQGAKQGAKATETEHSTATKPKTEPMTEPKTELKTETETEPNNNRNTELNTEMKRMGVLLNSNDTVLYSHGLPVTSLFTELENANVLNYTDYLQYCNTEQRRTVDSFSLYLHYKTTDQATVIERIESLFQKVSSATAYKS